MRRRGVQRTDAQPHRLGCELGVRGLRAAIGSRAMISGPTRAVAGTEASCLQ